MLTVIVASSILLINFFESPPKPRHIHFLDFFLQAQLFQWNWVTDFVHDTPTLNCFNFFLHSIDFPRSVSSFDCSNCQQVAYI